MKVQIKMTSLLTGYRSLHRSESEVTKRYRGMRTRKYRKRLLCRFYLSIGNLSVLLTVNMRKLNMLWITFGHLAHTAKKEFSQKCVEWSLLNLHY